MMRSRVAPRPAQQRWVRALLLFAVLSCDAKTAEKAAPPARVDHPVTESDLTAVTLTQDAERRLGIQVAAVERRAFTPTRSLGGDVMAAPGHQQTLVAPGSGIVAVPASGQAPAIGTNVRAGQALLRLLTLPAGGDLMRTGEELRIAEARLRQAELEAQRAERLFADRLISGRDREKAQADLEVARATRDATRSRAGLVQGERSNDAAAGIVEITAPENGVLQALHVGIGQTVTAGTPLLDVVRVDLLWVRVPIFVGDLDRVDRRAAARVRGLGGVATDHSVTAQPMSSVPVADAVSASADLYYVLPSGAAFRPGARVQVAVPLRGTAAPQMVVPFAAVVYDASGGSWVYERVAERRYVRRRVELGAVVDGWAALRRGPAVGASVVTVGVAELFGTEFGPGK